MTTERDRQLRAAAVKLALFAVASVLVTVTVAATVRPFGGGGSGSYRAIFSSASQLAPGDDVRASGVVVGKVEKVRLLPDATAAVQFSLSRRLDLTSGTTAAIRYLNLTGDRTLSLQQGPGEPLAEGSTIPLARTTPALDLNQLFNGFKPLFAALSPDDVNALSLDIVRTLQGEGSTVTSLIRHTASLTRTVADRDVLIGRVIQNLNTVLGTVGEGQGRLDQLVGELTRFTRGLAEDRSAIGTAIEQVGQLTSLTTDLLRDARPGLRTNIDQVRRIAETLDRPANLAEVEHLVEHLPEKFARIARTASYGSWFNYYACRLQVTFLGTGTGSSILDLLARTLGSLNLDDRGKRCQL